MSNSYSCVTVLFERDVKEEELQNFMTAVKCIRNVLSVEPTHIDSMSMYVAEGRVRAELADKLYEVLYPKTK